MIEESDAALLEKFSKQRLSFEQFVAQMEQLVPGFTIDETKKKSLLLWEKSYFLKDKKKPTMQEWIDRNSLVLFRDEDKN